jgi:hypothetical protein
MKTSLTVRVDESLFSRLDEKRFLEKVSLQEAAVKLLTKWVDGEEKIPPPARHEKWLNMLLDILDSGHPNAVKAVTENLMAFHRLVEVDKPSRPHRKAKAV